MKKLYILLILLMMSACMATAQENRFKLPTKGYSGEVGGAFGLGFAERGAVPMGELSTTHGYQFNSKIFLGAGITTINTQFISLYGQVSLNLRRPTEVRPSYPFFAFRAGYMTSTWVGEYFSDEKGIYLEPKLGWSFYSKLGNLRYNVFAAVSYYQFSFIPKVGLSFEF